ncbi:cyclopropane-fatty-acyl-phospholipid synthase family protein [Ruegeria sp. Ofav3-42]|uniref:SAM-dependent methyltransferase n=1 Tax=Ruegeria sp. Ofav3-42 TaxID=2917759 RepID=UPI001EF71C2A|nr:class I SAM-dependent methyltransferase [Ruegeria sp. Ofav3-42]MCG7520430.1 class I SAM-dependent methyltransferase [Ruegeria sp. Ofav3-42]
MTYVHDAEHNIWVRKDSADILYSDGVAKEDRLFDGVESCKDRSVNSPEINALITDWASEYHFSAKRHFVLKGLEFEKNQAVLELGCGCGAISRYLAEQGVELTSVEGTVSRARTASRRCEDLPNAEFYVDNFTKFQSEKKFDWVLFIGVLEYAPLFGDKADPFGSYLDVAKRHLKPGGKVVIAIENKLGLKYWNGASEDHVGRPYYGIHDLYDGRSAETFSKLEIATLLADNGFEHQEFHYAFPDYKICDTLITEVGLSSKGFNAADLLLGSRSRDYSRKLDPAFTDGLAISTLSKAGLLGEFANSFLITASAQEFTQSTKLALTHNIGKRHPAFTCETSFSGPDCEISVQKTATLSGPHKKIEVGRYTICHDTASASYIDGDSEAGQIIRQMHRTPRPVRLWRSFIPWAEYLKAACRQTSGTSAFEDMTLDGSYIDATPFNFIRTNDGLTQIDVEWRAEQEIPLGWVIARGVRQVLMHGSSNISYNRARIFGTVRLLLEGMGLTLSEDEYERVQQLERAFMSAVQSAPAKKKDQQYRGELIQP